MFTQSKLRFISKSQLAREAGISPRTLSRYLHDRQDVLQRMGVSPKAKKLPPYVVSYLAHEFCFDL